MAAMTAMPISHSAAAWTVRVVFRLVESGSEGPSGARHCQQYGSSVRVMVAWQAPHWRVAVWSMWSDSIWMNSQAAIEPNQLLAAYLYLIGSNVT